MQFQINDPADLRQAARGAAEALESGAAAGPLSEELLAALGYGEGGTQERLHHAALLRAAAGLRRLFVLMLPDAPGAIAVGGEAGGEHPGEGSAPTVSVSGVGTTLRHAFESCAGEAVEYMSICSAPPVAPAHQLITALCGGGPAAQRRAWHAVAPFRRAGADAAAELMADCMEARLVSDGARVWLPADWCRWRPGDVREYALPWPLSTGCAAAPDPAMAASLGLLELIERDAAALWWCAGRPARVLAADGAAAAEAAQLLAALRGRAGGRMTWLLDITSDIAVPVIAAVSCEADGTGLCCGMAARPARRSAVRRAVLEMCQMELGARIAAIVRDERGAAAHSGGGRPHAPPMQAIDAAACDSLRAVPPPSPVTDLPPLAPAALRDRLCGMLQQAGLQACIMDLTNPVLGVPVMRAVCPGLQLAASPPAGQRLAVAARQFGRSLDPWPPCPFL
jgi:ribosomal protein S12 methylthiotransferase accessory factor